MDDAYLLWYIEEISQVAPLPRDEEFACVEHIRAADPLAESARERMIEAHVHLVVPIAQRYRTGEIHIGELIAVGNQALLAALPAFINSSAESFAAHAAPLIEHALANAVANPESAGISGCYFHHRAIS